VAFVRCPAYDMNANPDGAGLALNISETDNTLDLELVTDVAKQFRVKAARAKIILAEVREAVATWPTEAKRARLPRAEQERMAPAFALATR
jgi:serine/threonine-protein kinase HipA